MTSLRARSIGECAELASKIVRVIAGLTMRAACRRPLAMSAATKWGGKIV
jgi:hypothetical protein